MTAYGPNHKPRRDSFDVDDPAIAHAWQPVGDGTVVGGLKFRDAYLDVFDEWADTIKKKGAAHELTSNCRKVLEKLFACMDFATGVCEPSLDKLQEKTRFARATVVRALAMLAKHKFIDWFRRSMPTGNAPGEGPPVIQVSNAYFLDLGRLNTRIKMALRQKLRKRRVKAEVPDQPRRSTFAARKARSAVTLRERWEDKAYALANATTPEEVAAIHYPNDSSQRRQYTEMLRSSGWNGASSGASLNPPRSIKG